MRFHTTILAAALLLCVYTAVAAPSASSGPADLGATGAWSTSGERSIGPSVSEYLGPDGRIDLEAIRASGYQGALDLKGFEVRTDEQLGLVVEPSVQRTASSNPDDVYWSEGFGGQGMDNNVFALTVYNNRLIAGGAFTTAGGVTANRIAAWDGATWSALGSGINGSVSALTVYANKLIAGGAFTTAGGVAANRIAAWDGATWSALTLGSGTNNYVRALTVYDNKLIAGGEFTTAGGDSAKYIAAWDGATWSALGSGMNFYVYALTVYDNKLIAGGAFTIAGDKASCYIAQWTKGVAGAPVEPLVNHPNLQSFPNPFRDITRLAFGLEREEAVTLAIYDVRGRLVRTLVHRRMGAGEYSQEWDGSDDRGNAVPSGIYFWHLEAADQVVGQKTVLLR